MFRAKGKWLSKTRQIVFSAMLTGALVSGASAQQQPEYTAKDRFFLRQGDVQVAIDPASAFTLRQVTVNGNDLIVTVGFGGFVLAYPGPQWVGSGHTEGGREKVEEVSLEVDGQRVDLPLGQTLDVGSTAILRKTSRLREDVTLRTETRFENGVLQEIINAEFHNPEKVDYLYPFMYCWSPQTESWMAETADGEIVEGTFASDGSWKLGKNVRWTSVFSPKTGVGAVVVFDKDLPAGQGRKHAFWDLDRYHKQYFQLFQSTQLPAGTTLKLVSTLHFFTAQEEAEWKQTAATLSKPQQ